MADTLQGKIEEAESGIAGVYQSFIAANGKLRSEISRTYATVDALTGTKTLLGSEIEQNADKISLVVESTDTGGDVIRAASIVTAINGGGSEVVISADHIDVDGVLTVGKNSGDILGASDVTEITKDTITVDYLNSKNITAAAIHIQSSSGKDLLSAGGNAVSIAGWAVDSNSLYNYPSGVTDYGGSVFVSTGTENRYQIGNSGLISGWCFGAGGRFGVTRDGAVYANDIHILPTDSQWSQIGSFYVSGDNFQSFRPPTNPTGVWNMMMSASQLTTMYTAGSTSTAHSSTWVNVALAGAEMENGASDPKVKTDIGGLDSRYDDAFYRLRPCRFKYTFGTSGRYHPGFIATEMQEAVLAAGLSTGEFSPLVHLKVPMENGSEWMIRLEKLVPLCVDQIQKLAARVAVLEQRKEKDGG